MNITSLIESPDSLEKLMNLESYLLRLQHHGGVWEKANAEWKRLFPIYQKQREERIEKLCKTQKITSIT